MIFEDLENPEYWYYEKDTCKQYRFFIMEGNVIGILSNDIFYLDFKKVPFRIFQECKYFLKKFNIKTTHLKALPSYEAYISIGLAIKRAEDLYNKLNWI